MPPLMLLALAFAAIILIGSGLVMLNDWIESGVRRLRDAQPRPARARRPGRRQRRQRLLT